MVKKLPRISDYAAFFLASAKFESGDSAGVAKTLEPVFKMTPVSPLIARAVLLEAKAADGKAAVDVLKKNYSSLPQPAGDMALATAFASSGDSTNAAVYYQRVYYGYPASQEAADSDTELSKLRKDLGEKYPPPMPSAMLGRAVKLMEAKQYAKARTELEALAPQLAGSEKDLARVKISVADYNAKDTLRAHNALAALEVSTPEADAERLHYLLLCAQRLKNQDEVNGVLEKLARLYPNSKWRLDALIAAASHELIENQMRAYEPIYRACYESLPKSRAQRSATGKSLGATTCVGRRIRWRCCGRICGYFQDPNMRRTRFTSWADYRTLRALALIMTRSCASIQIITTRSIARERLKEIGNVAPSPKVTEFLRTIEFSRSACGR